MGRRKRFKKPKYYKPSPDQPLASNAIKIQNSPGATVTLHKKGNKTLGVWETKDGVFIVGIKQPSMIKNKDGSMSTNPQAFNELSRAHTEDEARSTFDAISKMDWHLD